MQDFYSSQLPIQARPSKDRTSGQSEERAANWTEQRDFIIVGIFTTRPNDADATLAFGFQILVKHDGSKTNEVILVKIRGHSESINFFQKECWLWDHISRDFSYTPQQRHICASDVGRWSSKHRVIQGRQGRSPSEPGRGSVCQSGAAGSSPAHNVRLVRSKQPLSYTDANRCPGDTNVITRAVARAVSIPLRLKIRDRSPRTHGANRMEFEATPVRRCCAYILARKPGGNFCT